MPTFGIVRLAVPNTRVDCSPYGQSVFVDAVDAIKSVDLAFNALINEADAVKMRVFLSNVMFDQEKDASGRRVPIPFGKGDCTVFRKAMSTEDTITELAPALCTDAQSRALLACERPMGHELPDEGGVRVVFDGSIVQDTMIERRQDMDEVVAGLMDRAEYRAKWYGESRK